MSIADILKYAQSITVGSMLIFILLGGYKRWWVWGYQLVDMKKDRDEWKELALRGYIFAERAIHLAATRGSAVEKQ